MFLITLMTMFLHTQVQQYPTVAAAGQQERILIVAPHIDDESIGAAGYAADALANGAEVFVVFLTAGDCNRFSARLLNHTLDPSASNYLSVGRTRIAEAAEAMQLLGVPRDHYFILGYPDRGLRAIVEAPDTVVRSRATHERSVPYEEALSPGSPYRLDNVMHDVESILDRTRPTVVIAPVAFDNHSDHAAAAVITDRALAEMHLHVARLGYLVHSGRIARSLVNVPGRALRPPARMQSFAWATYPLTSAVQQKKSSVLMTYRSQRPYVYMLRNAFVRTNELFLVER